MILVVPSKTAFFQLTVGDFVNANGKFVLIPTKGSKYNLKLDSEARLDFY